MITGAMSASLEPMVPVRVFGSNQSIDVDAVIDTGFTGHLTLPQSQIQSLGVQYRGARKAQLADGNIVPLSVYRATVDWDGQVREVQIVEAEGSPLLGMAMLSGFRLRLDVAPGGQILIEALPTISSAASS